jgi:general stress protein YciG
MKKEDPKSKGGKARADALSKERRSEIAKKGGDAKWDKSAPAAILGAKLTLGGVEVDCYVTEHGDRLIAGRGVQDLLKLVDSDLPTVQKPGSRLTRLLNNATLKPLIFKNKPLDHFAPKKSRFQGVKINGYNAEMIVDICEGMLDARADGGLLKTPRQHAIAAQCELILRGLAKTGIVALIDEATGYQSLRPADGLRTYFDAILRKDLAAWLKKFPDEFYENIYKLKEWPWPGMGKNRFSVVAHYTNDLIYERIAPGLTLELAAKNPKNEKGHRPAKHHQWLNEEAGEKLFSQQMFAVLMIQRACLNRSGDKWRHFLHDMDTYLPKKGHTIPLDLPIPDAPIS